MEMFKGEGGISPKDAMSIFKGKGGGLAQASPEKLLGALERMKGEDSMTRGDALSILKGKGRGAQTNTKGLLGAKRQFEDSVFHQSTW